MKKFWYKIYNEAENTLYESIRLGPKNVITKPDFLIFEPIVVRPLVAWLDLRSKEASER